MSFPLRPLVEELVDHCARSGDRSAADRPRIMLDIHPAHVVEADPAAVRPALQALLEAAIAAASCPAAASDGPALHEVMITSVQRPDALEIEIADSGPAAPHALDITLAAARSRLARLGGQLRVEGCPEGGRAVTLVVPRRAAQRLAA